MFLTFNNMNVFQFALCLGTPPSSCSQYSQFYVESMYDDIRIHVARSYTSSASSPFYLVSSFTLSNPLLLALPPFFLPRTFISIAPLPLPYHFNLLSWRLFAISPLSLCFMDHIIEILICSQLHLLDAMFTVESTAATLHHGSSAYNCAPEVAWQSTLTHPVGHVGTTWREMCALQRLVICTQALTTD